MEWEGKGFNINGDLEYEIKNGNGQIKRYTDEGDLAFEGKILNVKINGYGKKYSEELTFEGFYKNGKKNGYGKEYKSGKLIYEGNYPNNKRHGHGKLFNADGNIIFEGEFIYGEKIENISEEKGKESNPLDPLIFDGEFLNEENKWIWKIVWYRRLF